MKKKIIWVLILVLFLGLGFANRAAIAAQYDRLAYHSICDNPIKFKIGKIDNRFNLTESQYISHINDATSIWSTAAGKQLFVYDPEGELTISLEYDERQSLNSQINELDTKLDEQNKELEPKIDAYEQRVANFKQKAAALNREIDDWNSKGGAPMEVYDGLVARQQALQQESRQLQAQAAELGQSTQEYNAEVRELSDTVDTYNEALRFKPEEGIYIQDQEGKRIIIYFYNTHEELVHTLAHELGHALGMDHIPNPKAIMFSRTNNAIIPTSEDLAALSEVCTRRSVIELAKERISYVVSLYKESLQNKPAK